jgi:flagellin
MRGQIRGLKQAQRNAQDGISLIQTAEGALNETHSILQRMRELAVQSSTDTNTDADRKEIQEEINQLYAEIDRIANTTQFNTMNLLDGSYSGKFFHIGANEGQHVDLDIAAMGAADLGVHQQHQADAVEATGTIQGIEITAADGTNYEVEFVAAESASQDTSAEIVDGKIVVTLGTGAEAEGEFDINAKLSEVVDAINEIDGITASLADDVDGDGVAAEATGALTGGSPALEEDITVPINVSSQVTANQAIDIIDKAVVQVSGERSKLGAMQNRLEHTIANLGTSAENLQAAEARIRDLDMAEEIMAFTKNNILQQAATAMLAQANMAPQSVLQLLG